jgi:cbb3-type cytochrome oxidase subunit 3
LYQTHYAAGEVVAVIVSLLFYAGITFMLMRSRRRRVAYLLFAVLLGSLLWSTGAFVLLHLFSW